MGCPKLTYHLTAEPRLRCVYNAADVAIRIGNEAWKIYYIHRDYLGSICAVTNIPNGNDPVVAVEKRSYDAWGRLRKPTTLQPYGPGEQSTLFLNRGYTGHEHLPEFGLINCNARLYDPVIGRFLSPDPYVQAPDFSQSFNRYSYCLNNPMIYVDENGEFWNIIIGAVIGGTTNLIANWGKVDGNFWKGLGYFSAGAVVGAVSSGVGSWASSATQALGALPGAMVGAGMGAVTGAASSVTLNGLNNTVGGQNFWNDWQKSAVSGAIGGAISGAISGGIAGFKNAKAQGADPWTGRLYTDETTYSANLKQGIPLQGDPEKYCYAHSLEYADAGHENRDYNFFVDKAGNVPGADAGQVFKKVDANNFNWSRKISGKQWNNVGGALSMGKEILGTTSRDGVSHWVNLTSVTTADKMRLFGGGFRRVLHSTTIWDPIRGHVNGPNSFFSIVSLF